MFSSGAAWTDGTSPHPSLRDDQVMWYYRRKIRGLTNVRHDTVASVCQSRLPSLRPIRTDRLTERSATLCHVITELDDNIFQELMEYVP
jgi:hypothetical protein